MIDDAEQKHYLVQRTLGTISMQFHSPEQLQDQNYMPDFIFCHYFHQIRRAYIFLS